MSLTKVHGFLCGCLYGKMCLARRARVLSQNGLEYTAQNIDGLLARRHENKKLLRAGKHPKGPAKRTKEQDEAFAKALEKTLSIINKNQQNNDIFRNT